MAGPERRGKATPRLIDHLIRPGLKRSTKRSRSAIAGATNPAGRWTVAQELRGTRTVPICAKTSTL